jgi:hypothetical protein
MHFQRKQCWEIVPYPSIGALTWLNPYITFHEAHDTILAKVKDGATIVDCGCFISTDLRYLASKGAPTKNMCGFDIEPRFFDIGFEFYNDRDRWQGSFLVADGTKRLEDTALAPLIGKVDIVWCPKYIHLYDRPHQVEVAANLIRLLKPRAGSIFAGSQNGYPVPEEKPLADGGFQGQQKSFFIGNAETLREIWDEAAAQTGTKWELDARLLDLRTIGLHQDDGSEYKRKVGYTLQWTATLIELPTSQN